MSIKEGLKYKIYEILIMSARVNYYLSLKKKNFPQYKSLIDTKFVFVFYITCSTNYITYVAV